MALLRNFICIVLLITGCISCQSPPEMEKEVFKPTEETSKPWVYWYWMHSAYSKEGITVDLEAMKRAGIGGAYLMSIKGPTDPPLIDPPILQLSEAWWDMVRFAMTEADRLGLELAMHASDGFAVAGGPWITPEMSMQKVVWSDTIVKGGGNLGLSLPVPEHYEDYYEDIAVFAIKEDEVNVSSAELLPEVSSTLEGVDASFLTRPGTDGDFELEEKGWIQYEFKEPFTCKSIIIEPDGNNYQAHRLIIEVSDDGIHFERHGRLTPPRHGWQDSGIPYTHSIEPVTAKFFRFVYDPEGSEPGAEDLDAAKWEQELELDRIILSSEPRIGNYQGKSGIVWRISPATTTAQISKEDCITSEEMLNISDLVDNQGRLSWDAPEGNWRIMRFGHTSTGQENETGGAGKGLEVDKFNPEAVRFQFDQWFGEAIRTAGPEMVPEVLSILHIDSWEAGSQNWSPVFREEFKKRRGYDIVDYLPVMAGIPLISAETSEKILHDVRKTISELITDNFFGTMAEEADKFGIKFSSENVAPTMVSDALLHFKKVDFPGGEFWLRSPTHDKPNDMLDAISGAHIYGKNIVQAEAYTQLRMDWDEHPGNLKVLGDRNYALGINRFFYHVFVHNPWLDRKPGMTLDGIGTFFQRDQTWWEPGKAWVDYAQQVQFLLQKGDPVIDLAVFTGEEIPSRAVLPDRLVPFIPNVFGPQRVASEKKRLRNEGLPVATMPKEVSYSKNMTDLSEWINPLNGYKYDSFNPDAFLHDANVKNGKIIFRGGVEYEALLFPGSRRMSPNKMLSLPVAKKMLELIEDGASVFVPEKPVRMPGYDPSSQKKEQWQDIVDKIWDKSGNLKTYKNGSVYRRIGKGRVIYLPYEEPDFKAIGIRPDLLFPDLSREEVGTIAWTHRQTQLQDIYFLSNQLEKTRNINVSFRVTGKKPYLYDPVQDKMVEVREWKIEAERTIIPLKFNKNEALFVIFKEETDQKSYDKGENWLDFETLKDLDNPWVLFFDPEFHGPSKPVKTDHLFDWSTSENDSIKYYSGTATYKTTFSWNGNSDDQIWLDLGEIANIAEVSLNGKDCGIIWTFPYRINITEALQSGQNELKIKVTNTWANRLIGDQKLPEEERLTWTTAPFRLEDMGLLKAGLLGPVTILKAENN